MRSRASFKSHPIHPMLIPYPFAFLTGGWAFGVAAAARHSADLRTVWQRLVPVGIAAGLVAAVPGLIDYAGSVPPASSGRQRALKHALLNTTALALFGAGWALSRRGRSAALPLMLQGLGTAALSIAGWMGGTLAYRNQIGVDHRYANAGRWQEERRGDAQALALVSAAAGLEPGQMKLVHANGDRIVVARTGDGVVAFQDRCPHKGGPLSDGALVCGVVQCPWHGSQFDVKTGAVKAGPAKEPIKTYPVDSIKPA